MNQFIEALQDKISDLEKEIDEFNKDIAAFRAKCDHELDDLPNAWWCKHCGGDVPKSTDGSRHGHD